MWRVKDSLILFAFWGVLLLSLGAPLLWILSVSLQVRSAGGYELWPHPASFGNYLTVLADDTHAIRTSLLQSLALTIVSSTIAMVVSLCAVYLVTAGVISPQWRRRMVTSAVGLYFLPAFAIHPGLCELRRVLPPFGNSIIQLGLVDSLFGFATSFILLLLVYSSVPRSDFEQLLLETRSRFLAFWHGVARPHRVATVVIGAVTFASIWSEFFLASLITGADIRKPFSVILQMSAKQYSIEYSAFAAGAVLSLVICLVVPFLALLCFRLLLRQLNRATPARTA